MCAEAVPWRCHRSLIADALIARGSIVEHIMSEKSSRVHTITSFARVRENRVTYPLSQELDKPSKNRIKAITGRKKPKAIL
jgi:uncharacterized protein (DUF488 family)